MRKAMELLGYKDNHFFGYNVSINGTLQTYNNTKIDM